MAERTLDPRLVLHPDHVPPAVITPAGRTVTWFGTDTQARFAAAPHPSLGPDDVSYRFNALGYRGADWPERGPEDLTLLSVGASEVFGLGVPEENAFPSILARLLAGVTGRRIVDVNLGLCGASLDYVSRTLASALPALQADIVVFVVPSPVRREHVDDLGRAYLYPNAFSPTWWRGVLNRLKYRFGDPANHQQNAAHDAITGEVSDRLNAFRNLAACQWLCQRHGAMWIVGSFIEGFLAPVRHLVDEAHLVSPGLADLRDAMLQAGQDPREVWARDMGHPGTAPHQAMAQRCLQRLQALYGSDLCRRPLPAARSPGERAQALTP